MHKYNWLNYKIYRIFIIKNLHFIYNGKIYYFIVNLLLLILLMLNFFVARKHEMLHENVARKKYNDLLSIYSKNNIPLKMLHEMLHEKNTLKSNNIYYYSNKMLHENTKF